MAKSTKQLQYSLYHRVLRVMAVVMAVVVVFESGLLSQTTAHMSVQTHMYLANAVGMSASVEPTELNSLTAELTRQKKALDDREAALNDREIAVNLAESGAGNERAIYLLAGVLFILLVLIIINYILDFVRSRSGRKVVPV